MIVLDTNVISEVVKPSPSPAVVKWLNSQESTDLHITAMTLGEVSYSIEILPTGKRRRALTTALGLFVDNAFGDRILNFDRESASTYGKIMANRRGLGKPMTVSDGQIAAIARRHGYQVATRNINDFKDCGLTLTNPFNFQ